MLKLKQSIGEKIVLKDSFTGHHAMTITTMLATQEQLAIHNAPILCRVEYPANNDGYIPTTWLPVPEPDKDWMKFGKILFRISNRKRATVTYCFLHDEEEVIIKRVDNIRESATGAYNSAYN